MRLRDDDPPVRTRPTAELASVFLTLVVLGALATVFLALAAGVMWTAAFGVAAAVAVGSWGRRELRRSPAAPPADGISRLLVVADPGCRSEAVADGVERVAAGRPTEAYVVAPAPTLQAASRTGADADARRVAEVRLDETLAFLAAVGVKARAAIGDGDALRATDDVLSRFPAAEIVYVTH